MAQSGKHVRLDDTQVEESTPTQTPVEEANSSRANSLLLLTVSFLEIPSFMNELSKENIFLHDQIQKKMVTLEHLKEEESVPRSLHFKFKLEIPSTSPAALTDLQNQCDNAFKTSQNTIKQVIIKACEKNYRI